MVWRNVHVPWKPAIGSLWWAWTSVNHGLYHSKLNPLPLGWRQMLHASGLSEKGFHLWSRNLYIVPKFRKMHLNKTNAEMSSIIWLQGSLTHWILWNLSDFSHSETQTRVKLSCYLANEDTLFIPARSVWFCALIILKQWEWDWIFLSTVYTLPPRILLMFLMCAPVFSPFLSVWELHL